MNSLLKTFVKESFKLVGLEISKSQPESVSPLVYHQIDLVFDVGASVGQFALGARQEGYKNRIVSFEPLSSAYVILMENSKNDSNWIIHERCAIGSTIGETSINIAKNSYSSSLLPMLAAHSSAAPQSIYVGTEPTKVITLDSVFNAYYKKSDHVFLKIDTQGFEKQVIDGARDCLKNIKGVRLELSIAPLYESQYLYEYFFNFFKDNEFILWSLMPGLIDPGTSQMLQFDATFIRPN